MTKTPAVRLFRASCRGGRSACGRGRAAGPVGQRPVGGDDGALARFHPHVGVQLDTGLQAPLIVEDPAEPGGYDMEVVLVLDDWTDGWGDSPQTILERMAREGMVVGGTAMDGMGHEGSAMEDAMPSPDRPLGADTGDVAHPAHLINGRLPEDPYVIRSRLGHRVRLRIINAGSDTACRGRAWGGTTTRGSA